MSNVFVIKQQNKHVSVRHNSRHYVIGFQTAFMARKVQYYIHPEPQIVVVKHNPFISLKNDLEQHGYELDLKMDTDVKLFIQKNNGSPLDPMNDGNFHFASHKISEFFDMPIKQNLGVIMPYMLEEEDEYEFMFRSCMIEPVDKFL